jgi:hypothetical protein
MGGGDPLAAITAAAPPSGVMRSSPVAGFVGHEERGPGARAAGSASVQCSGLGAGTVTVLLIGTGAAALVCSRRFVKAR